MADTAGDALGALALAEIDIVHDLVELGLVDLGALLGGRVKWIADLPRLVHAGQLVDQLVVDFLFDKHAATGTTALSLVEVQPGVGALRGGIQIGIAKDDVGALAAQLERESL